MERVKLSLGSVVIRIAITLSLVIAIGAVIYYKKQNSKQVRQPPNTEEKISNKLPLLIDLGAGKCQACKAMVSVIDSLSSEYSDLFNVKIIDIYKQKEEAEKYKVMTIPTQVFLDKKGKELFRHIGFFSKEDILKKWKELGIEKTSKGGDK